MQETSKSTFQILAKILTTIITAIFAKTFFSKILGTIWQTFYKIGKLLNSGTTWTWREIKISSANFIGIASLSSSVTFANVAVFVGFYI